MGLATLVHRRRTEYAMPGYISHMSSFIVPYRPPEDLERRIAARTVRPRVDRSYQIDCIETLSDKVTRSRGKPLVQMATGTGKTRTAAAFPAIIPQEFLTALTGITVRSPAVSELPLDEEYEDAITRTLESHGFSHDQAEALSAEFQLLRGDIETATDQMQAAHEDLIERKDLATQSGLVSHEEFAQFQEQFIQFAQVFNDFLNSQTENQNNQNEMNSNMTQTMEYVARLMEMMNEMNERISLLENHPI